MLSVCSPYFLYRLFLLRLLPLEGHSTGSPSPKLAAVEMCQYTCCESLAVGFSKSLLGWSSERLEEGPSSGKLGMTSRRVEWIEVSFCLRIRDLQLIMVAYLAEWTCQVRLLEFVGADDM